jgi:hypothetical protein
MFVFDWGIPPLRHAELGSASRLEPAERMEDWTLKQVQGDDRAWTVRTFQLEAIIR